MEYAHPEDHKKISYKLPLGGFIFVAVIIACFLSMQEPEIKYTMSSEEIHQLVLLRNEVITPQEAAEILSGGEDGYRFIDLRNPHEFIAGHIEGAINIPANLVLTPDNRMLFADPAFTNILYAGSHAEVCGPWMVLRQTGHDNNRILLGGISSMQTMQTVQVAKEELIPGAYQDEAARYDFAETVRNTSGSGVNSTTRPAVKEAVPVAKKSRKQTQGGC